MTDFRQQLDPHLMRMGAGHIPIDNIAVQIEYQRRAREQTGYVAVPFVVDQFTVGWAILLPQGERARTALGATVDNPNVWPSYPEDVAEDLAYAYNTARKARLGGQNVQPA